MRSSILIFIPITMSFLTPTQLAAQGGESSGGGFSPQVAASGGEGSGGGFITYSTDQPVTVITGEEGTTYLILGELPQEAFVEGGIDLGKIDPKPTPRPLPPDPPLPSPTPSPTPTPCSGPFCPRNSDEALIYPPRDFGQSVRVLEMDSATPAMQ